MRSFKSEFGVKSYVIFSEVIYAILNNYGSYTDWHRSSAAWRFHVQVQKFRSMQV